MWSKQNRTRKDRTNQDIRQGRTGQERRRQDRGQERACDDRTRQDRIGQSSKRKDSSIYRGQEKRASMTSQVIGDRSKQNRTRKDRMEQDMKGHTRT